MTTSHPPVHFRTATRADLPTLIALLADDILGSTRETLAEQVSSAYIAAFAAIAADPRNELIVADAAGAVVGLLQLTYIPGLTHGGGERALIEGVRIAASHRSQGLGRDMFLWAIDRARQRGCRMVQLTTDKRRPDAHRFYAALGFVASHEGFKLHL